MRLLDKRTVNTEIAIQKAQEARKGLAMAKKVDAVRQTLQEEEQNLEIFRLSSIKKVQGEINIKIAERDFLEIGNERLREERFQAQAPIDLKRAWSEVRSLQAELFSWKNQLGLDAIELLAKEADIVSREDEFRIEKENIARAANLAQQNLNEAEIKFTQASDTFERAQRDSEKMLTDARERENSVKIREEDNVARDRYLSEQEQRVQAWEADLSGRERKLRVNQELFIKAQNYINKKKI